MPAVLPETVAPAPVQVQATAQSEPIVAATPAVEPSPAVEAAPCEPAPAVETISVAPVKEEITAGIEETVIEEPVIEEPVNEIPEVAEAAAAELKNEAAAGNPMQELWQKLLEISGDIREILLACTPLSLENSVLSIQAPAPTAAALRENRLKMLTLLQQASGNWAILLDVQSVNAAPQAVVCEAAPVPEPEVAEVQSETVPAYAVPGDMVPVSEEPLNTIPEGTTVEDNFEEFIDLTAIEDLPPEKTELSREDLGYSKRSVIHDQEEVNATAKLPPVQKVLDLFGGEIVDIHA